MPLERLRRRWTGVLMLEESHWVTGFSLLTSHYFGLSKEFEIDLVFSNMVLF